MGKRKQPPVAATWHQKFVCLSSTDADRVPGSKVDKLLLEEAGLGTKEVTVDLDSSPDIFRQQLFRAFPKLEFGGGYELLRCLPKSRDLCLIRPKTAVCPRLLKRKIGTGKVYIRPIQRDLSLEEVVESEGEEVCCVCAWHAMQ